MYGPVPSRRLGLSLGIDVVPHKHCTYDCVYCQLGPTPAPSMERREFVPVARVLRDVAHALSTGPRPEVLTLAGSGEPTLYEPLLPLIEGLRALSDLPLVLITNSSLLHLPEVAKAALAVDVLCPSLDAGDAETFGRVNGPAAGLSFETMLRGLRAVTDRHAGTVRQEVMLARGVNDQPESLAAIARQLESLRADVIEINTPVRAVPGRAIFPCSAGTLHAAQALFGERARIIGRYEGPAAGGGDPARASQEIWEFIARRPATSADLIAALGLDADAVSAALEHLAVEGRARSEPRGDELHFYGLGQGDAASGGSAPA